MSRTLSVDFRIDDVKSFGVSVANVRSWRNCQLRKGNVLPGSRGGNRNSYKTDAYGDQIMTWLGEHRDCALFELRDDLAAQGIAQHYMLHHKP